MSPLYLAHVSHISPLYLPYLLPCFSDLRRAPRPRRGAAHAPLRQRHRLHGAGAPQPPAPTFPHPHPTPDPSPAPAPDPTPTPDQGLLNTYYNGEAGREVTKLAIGRADVLSDWESTAAPFAVHWITHVCPKPWLVADKEVTLTLTLTRALLNPTLT